MNQFLHGMARAIAESFPLPEPIVEIGSYQVVGQETLSLRPLFAGKQYLGVDMRAGPGVDRVADVEALPFPDGSVGTIVALSTFEHVRCFWRGLDEVYRVLRPDGGLLLSCPFYFHIHSFPSDYWRFTPEALRVLLERYPTKIIGWHGAKNRPSNVWALAFRERHPPIAATQFEQYRQKLRRYGRQPLSLRQQVRYRLGRLLCGRGPFAPLLDQERWDSICENPATTAALRQPA